MTNKKNDDKKVGNSLGISSFRLEANRTSRGICTMLSGVIGISDFSDERVVLLSHGGRIMISGKRLFINVFENNNVEIVGKVEEISFRYGKH